MGTNYYATIPIKKRDKERAKKLIDANELEEAINLVDQMKKSQNIHLGKRSAGWKFFFDSNDLKYFEPTREGLNRFFSDNHVIIKDEYGKVFTVDEFWENIEDVLCKGWDLETYYRDNPEELKYFCESKSSKIFDKYNPNVFGEFYSDGLRFSTFSDFC